VAQSQDLHFFNTEENQIRTQRSQQMKNANLPNAIKARDNTWAEIYSKAHIAELLSISLPTFLTAPVQYLTLAGQETAPTAIIKGFRPLLPAQIAACRRIQLNWQAQENGERTKQAAPLVTA
jgi:hypothetical protein